MSNESINVDIVIIGAGPAGLSAAIRIKQLCQQYNKSLSVCILEKGAEVGAHILSGAVLEPGPLNTLIPDWHERNAPLHTKTQYDYFYYLSKGGAYRLPTPPQMRNKNNYIISLSKFCRWLAQQAEQLGIEIYPATAATQVLYNAQNQVTGIVTGVMGIDKNGQHTDRYQPGTQLLAKQILLAEGCHGSLTEQIIQHYDLRAGVQQQTYALGVKELWEIDRKQHRAGTVLHSIGWPLNHRTYGGSFVYHLEQNRLALGFVIGLDYNNPSLDPFAELQRFKTHPLMQTMLAGGKRLEYGARALNEGGYQSIPKLTFPGGVIIGDCGGFLNVPKIKGIHNAMRSAMLGAEAVFTCLQQDKQEAITYQQKLQRSPMMTELYQARNIRPAFRQGLFPGLIYAALDTYLLRGKAPWTFKHNVDHLCFKKTNQCQKIIYPKPDAKITFDKLSSVYLSNTYHEENQPTHLILKHPRSAIDINLKYYDSPEQFYCPAAVYEITYTRDNQAKLQINAQNCLHCKACSIKDPTQNISWTPPEGGGGPKYQEM